MLLRHTDLPPSVSSPLLSFSSETAHAEHNLLQTHINLAEKISSVFKSKLFDRKLEVERWCIEGVETDAVEDYIEGCLAKNEPMLQVLRLMCLHSLTQGGLKPKKFDFFRREFLQTYGFSQLFTLNNLDRLGMFTSSGGGVLPMRLPPAASATAAGRGWSTLRKGLRLTTPAEKVDVSAPTDINYIFNGYAPLSVRLIELASKPGGWRRAEEMLAQVAGRAFEYRQEAAGVSPNPVNLLELKGSGAAFDQREERKEAAANQQQQASGAAGGGAKKKPLTLVCFLGGVTMAEISALRFLSEREDHGRDYIVCTTKLVNGATFIESIVEIVTNKLTGGTGAGGPAAGQQPPQQQQTRPMPTTAAAAGKR